jgi:hypothetical protein
MSETASCSSLGIVVSAAASQDYLGASYTDLHDYRLYKIALHNLV